MGFVTRNIMSLPAFTTQAELFSTAGLAGSLFGPTDRYRLFALKIYPVLAQARSQLEGCYCADNGRVALEPVLLLGVSLLQYLEGIPDRQAVERLRYHAGWNFALNRQLGDEVFHPATLVNFRQRLLDHDLSRIGFETVMEALIAAGLVVRQSRQRLDSTQTFGRGSRMSRLDCVRESLRLALQELAQGLKPEERPEWWPRLWRCAAVAGLVGHCGGKRVGRGNSSYTMQEPNPHSWLPTVREQR
jgi:transposase